MTWSMDINSMHARFGMVAGVDDMTQEVLAEFFEFRKRFLREELAELEDAEEPEDVVDALIDLCVVAIGTLDAFGVDGERAWAEVLMANLKKVAGPNPSRPNEFGLPDLQKPDGWVAPNHSGNVGILPRVMGVES
jgi:hypothetical protein